MGITDILSLLGGLALFLVSMKYGDRWEARLLEQLKR